MSDQLVIIGIVLLVGVAAMAIGIGFGIVVAPRITRWLDRAEADDEDAGDRTD